MTEKFRETAHFHGEGMFGYIFTSTTRPRLSYKETSYRKTRTTDRVWRVDGKPLAADAVEAALLVPPIFSDDEVVALERLSDEWADRELQHEIGWDVLRALTVKAAVEWKDGKVRLRADPPASAPGPGTEG